MESIKNYYIYCKIPSGLSLEGYLYETMWRRWMNYLNDFINYMIPHILINIIK